MTCTYNTEQSSIKKIYSLNNKSRALINLTNLLIFFLLIGHESAEQKVSIDTCMPTCRSAEPFLKVSKSQVKYYLYDLSPWVQTIWSPITHLATDRQIFSIQLNMQQLII